MFESFSFLVDSGVSQAAVCCIVVLVLPAWSLIVFCVVVFLFFFLRG